MGPGNERGPVELNSSPTLEIILETPGFGVVIGEF